MSSEIADNGDGSYAIREYAAPARGGFVAAKADAMDDAESFCADKGQHAVVVDDHQQGGYQTATGGSWGWMGGSYGVASYHSGVADLHFKCSAPQSAAASTSAPNGGGS